MVEKQIQKIINSCITDGTGAAYKWKNKPSDIKSSYQNWN